MKYISLGSGSRGNATLILEQQQGVLIDCGFSRKNLLERLTNAGTDPRQLDAVLVTHEHADHAKGVQTLCEALNIPLYATFGTARKMQWLDHPLWHCLYPDQTVIVGALEIMPVTVPHDAEEPVQFVLENSIGKRLGVLSDLGSITPHIISHYSDCHGLQLEANHDVEMLKNGPYPPSLRARVASDFGHLNNQQCAWLISQLEWHGLQNLTAGHISEKNNRLDLVSTEISQVIDCEAYNFNLLQQDQPSSWFELT